MAIKDKNKVSNHKLSSILFKEYKYEGLILGVVAAIGIVFGTMILIGDLAVDSSFPIIGGIPNVFAGILVFLSAVGLIVAVFPFVQPAFPEIKKISWPGRRDLIVNCLKVFFFMIFMAALLYFFDYVIGLVIKAMYGA